MLGYVAVDLVSTFYHLLLDYGESQCPVSEQHGQHGGRCHGGIPAEPLPCARVGKEGKRGGVLPDPVCFGGVYWIR